MGAVNMGQIEANYSKEDTETIQSLIEKLEAKGYQVKINVYKHNRKELRILTEKQ